MKELISFLQNKKNLLAFSGGVDSSALFFMLEREKVPFDLAIVNYGVRKEALQEVDFAKELAKKYNKKIFIANAPKFSSNFEAKAREFRYNFFETLIKKHSYQTLLLAHQLNDKLEWLLMRLGKGAGVIELSGMQKLEKRENFFLVRPLLDYTKEELLEYLEKNNLPYFIDKSNFNLYYERNRYRKIANALLKESGKKGVLRSFAILAEQKALLEDFCQELQIVKELVICKCHEKALIICANKILKRFGIVLSYKERQILQKEKKLVAKRKFVIAFNKEKLFIAPFIQGVVMPKKIKEHFRIKKIPPLIRPYCFRENLIDF